MDVQELLATAEPPAMRIDVQAAMLAGRRARRRRTTVWAATGVALVLGLSTALVRLGFGATGDNIAADSTGPPVTVVEAKCTDRRFEDAGATIHGSDPTGRYLFGYHHDSPALWGPSGRSIIDAGRVSFPMAVNSSGVVVGSADDLIVSQTNPPAGSGPGKVANTDGRAGAKAWVYRDGRVEWLAPLPRYENSAATSINARGDIAGIVSTKGGPSFAVVWPAGTSTPRRLEAQWPAVTTGIADDGTVIGKVDTPTVEKSPVSEAERQLLPYGGRPYVWAPDGTGRALEIPQGFAGGHPAAVHGRQGLGFVFPAPAGPETTVIPARWDLDTGKVTTLPSFKGKQWMGATSTGWITDGATIISPHTGRALRLPAPQGVDPDSIWFGSVSEDGRTVVGNMKDSDHRRTTIVWSCD